MHHRLHRRQERLALVLLARLSFAELNAEVAIDWLPRSGALLFFYDTHEQPWGFDPKDRDGHRVLYVPDLSEPAPALSRAAAPAARDCTLPQRTIEYRNIPTYPSFERGAMQRLALNDAEWERVTDLSTRAFANDPQHQLGGYPAPIQSDAMELECQLASSGLYVGNPAGYQDARAGRFDDTWVVLQCY